MLPVIFGHAPAGSAKDQLVHYSQEVPSGHFRQFDHGLVDNYRKYGRMTPPDYNLDNVQAKVALHYASDDWLASPQDVEKLGSKLPNVVGMFHVPHTRFNHVDFVWGTNVRTIVYDKILRLMRLAEANALP